MANKSFRKTEQAIFFAYCKFRDCPSVRKIASNAKISRATLYRHHKNAQRIPRDYEELIIATYNRRIKELIKKSAPVKTLFLCTLVFISRHKKVFDALFIEGRKDVIKQMLNRLKPAIITTWYYKDPSNQAYNVYENEVLGVIETWGKSDFSATKLDKTLSDILYLSKTAPERLHPLDDK